jgi:hypothetical protein
MAHSRIAPQFECLYSLAQPLITGRGHIRILRGGAVCPGLIQQKHTDWFSGSGNRRIVVGSCSIWNHGERLRTDLYSNTSQARPDSKHILTRRCTLLKSCYGMRQTLPTSNSAPNAVSNCRIPTAPVGFDSLVPLLKQFLDASRTLPRSKSSSLRSAGC